MKCDAAVIKLKGRKNKVYGAYLRRNGGGKVKKERVDLWERREYTYPLANGFIPNLVTYLHEDNEFRSAMLIVPGGGYCAVSPSEGEIVAKKFYAAGYQTFVLTYTTNLFQAAPLKRQPQMDLSRAIRIVRKNASAWKINSDKVVICGFSAGGHLCADVCVHYKDIRDTEPKYANISNRPDAAILCYPVITAGKYAHRDSFVFLLGQDATEEELEYESLEKQVTDDTPPCFLWHTATDDMVPVQNSILFAQALQERGILYAIHIFSDGAHGLSLADSEWASMNLGDGQYTMEQVTRVIQGVQEGTLPIPIDKNHPMLQIFQMNPKEAASNLPNLEVAVWPELADKWVQKILSIKK